MYNEIAHQPNSLSFLESVVCSTSHDICSKADIRARRTRSRVEAKMQCLKALGERIMARDQDRQTAEIRIRIALMNRLSTLGTAEIVRVD